MKDIIYSYYYRNNNPNLLNIIFSFSPPDIGISNEENNILSYICNNYYQNKDKFIDIYSINFNEQYRINLQNFIKSNKRIIIVDKANVGVVDNKNILYDFNGVNGNKNGFGQTNETAMLILSSILKADEYKYIIKDGENNGTLFSLPNIRLGNHFFVRMQHNNSIYCYDSNYEENLARDGEQFLTTPIQGLSDCFFFSAFFIRQSIRYGFDIRQLKMAKSNLEILTQVTDYIIGENNNIYLGHLKSNKIDNLSDKDKYYFFTNSDIGNSDFIFYIKNVKYNERTIEISDNSKVDLKDIYNQQNIILYCTQRQFSLYSYVDDSFIINNNSNNEINNYQNLSKSSRVYSSSSNDATGIQNSQNEQQQRQSLDLSVLSNAENSNNNQVPGLNTSNLESTDVDNEQWRTYVNTDSSSEVMNDNNQQVLENLYNEVTNFAQKLKNMTVQTEGQQNNGQKSELEISQQNNNAYASESNSDKQQSYIKARSDLVDSSPFSTQTM